MKISDLVAFRNKIKNIDIANIRLHLDILDADMSQTLDLGLYADYKDNISTTINKIDQVETLLVEIENKLSELVDKTNNEINALTKLFYKRGYVINGELGSQSVNITIERTQRNAHITADTRAKIIGRIREHTDWHYPALEIGPGDGIWTEHLVAADPLYLVDLEDEYLQNTLNKFNSAYRKRLRPYKIGDWVEFNDFYLMMLPVNQFGFIFSWNVFDYFPEYETNLMLDQCFQLLRPGGTMMFSYNNCDIPTQVKHVETGFKSWMPKTKLVAMCQKIGFNIAKCVDLEDTTSWIEITKPGELKTVKSHQVLGKIINRNA